LTNSGKRTLLYLKTSRGLCKTDLIDQALILNKIPGFSKDSFTYSKNAVYFYLQSIHIELDEERDQEISALPEN